MKMMLWKFWKYGALLSLGFLLAGCHTSGPGVTETLADCVARGLGFSTTGGCHEIGTSENPADVSGFDNVQWNSWDNTFEVRMLTAQGMSGGTRWDNDKALIVAKDACRVAGYSENVVIVRKVYNSAYGLSQRYKCADAGGSPGGETANPAAKTPKGAGRAPSDQNFTAMPPYMSKDGTFEVIMIAFDMITREKLRWDDEMALAAAKRACVEASYSTDDVKVIQKKPYERGDGMMIAQKYKCTGKPPA